MRKVIVHLQTTLNNRIAKTNGEFWEPFPWGPEEMRYITEIFREADTWAFGRNMYEAIVPWWTLVAQGEAPPDAPTLTEADHDFAKVFSGLKHVVFSNTLEDSDGRRVLGGDIAGQLADIKNEPGANIMLSCGPSALAALLATPGLIDEYLTPVHPAIITDGISMFDRLANDIPLRLIEAKVFAGGCVVLRHETIHVSA